MLFILQWRRGDYNVGGIISPLFGHVTSSESATTKSPPKSTTAGSASRCSTQLPVSCSLWLVPGQRNASINQLTRTAFVNPLRSMDRFTFVCQKGWLTPLNGKYSSACGARKRQAEAGGGRKNNKKRSQTLARTCTGSQWRQQSRCN